MIGVLFDLEEIKKIGVNLGEVHKQLSGVFLFLGASTVIEIK